MDCERTREKLSEHAEGLLPKDEAAQVAEHLASCEKCRETYDDLLKTVAHLKNLEEVAPPEWFTERVMARVKEEAARREGRGRAPSRLFPPKLPLAAAATVLIAIAALYIYRANQSVTTILPVRSPEVRLQPFTPHNEAEQENAGGKPIVRRPAPAPKEAAKREAPAAPLPGPPGTAGAPALADKGLAKAPAGKDYGATGNAPPPLLQVAPTGRPAGSEEGRVPPGAAESAAAVRGGASVPKAVGSATPAAPAPLRYRFEEKKKAAGYVPTVGPSLTLSVRDAARAREDIAKLLSQTGARVINEQSLAGRTTLTCELDAAKVREMRQGLERLGELRERRPLDGLGRGKVRITIEIRETPGR
jgi:hypothetical protein